MHLRSKRNETSNGEMVLALRMTRRDIEGLKIDHSLILCIKELQVAG